MCKFQEDAGCEAYDFSVQSENLVTHFILLLRKQTKPDLGILKSVLSLRKALIV